MVNFKIRFIAATAAIVCTIFQVSASNPLHAKNDTIADAGTPIASDLADDSPLESTLEPQWTVLAPGVAIYDAMPSDYA